MTPTTAQLRDALRELRAWAVSHQGISDDDQDLVLACTRWIGNLAERHP